LLSVLIIDTKIYDHYCKYDYFFGHLEHNNDLAVCVWNRQSMDDDIASMLPQLMDTVRNVPEWNAYVICEPHDPLAYLRDDFANNTQYAINPYERANRPDYDPEQDRLLRLLYLLGGRGDDSVDYIEQYQFRAARPSNIYLITPRLLKNIEQQKLFLLSQLREDSKGVLNDPRRVLNGEIDLTVGYSEFWARYEYPPSCRFLVYDFPEENHQTYPDTWFPFWIAVITMTQNRFTNAMLAPFKLHMLTVDIDDDRFTAYLNRFYTMLLENIDRNNDQILQEEQLAREEAANTDITVSQTADPITVTFPHFDVHHLFAHTDNFSLVKDRPVLDEHDWNSQMERTRGAMNSLFKAIHRGKSEAIDLVHQTFEDALPDLQDRIITKYDAEELQEAMNNDELEMIRLNAGAVTGRADFEKAQAKMDKVVRTYLRRRMRLKVAIALLASAMAIYFIGFLPYLIQSVSHSVSSFLLALPISGAALVIPAVGGIFGLWVLFRNLKKLVELYNNTIGHHFKEIQHNATVQGDYLTHMLDFMTKYQILSTARPATAHLKQIDELLIANAIFEDAITACRALAIIRGVPLTRITDVYIHNNIDALPQSRIFLCEENDETPRTAFNSMEDALAAPFSFTDGITLRTEELYECPAYPAPPTFGDAPDGEPADEPDDTQDKEETE